MNERVIERRVFHDARGLILALTSLMDTRCYHGSGYAEVNVQHPDTSQITAFELIETTLSDGSKTYDVRFVERAK